MRFEWENDEVIGSYWLHLFDDDGKELDVMWIKDHTAPWNVQNDQRIRAQRRWAYEVGYCKGFSFSRGFDEYKDWANNYGYHGKPTHTLDDIKRFCENYIAQMYLQCYQRAVATLDEKRRRAAWFEANGFVLEEVK